MKVIELKQDMDAQFRAVRSQMDARFADTQTQMDSRFAEMDAKMDTRFAEMDAKMDTRFQGVDARFQGVDARFTAMEQRITAEGEHTRRHFDVVAEQLRGDISLLATTVATISTTLEHSMSERGTMVSPWTITKSASLHSSAHEREPSCPGARAIRVQ